ncbi:hypothetical protein [Rhodanobacter sp. C03]|uniref:hypothetical protein n=1 Tax=Rhodanobacter sp. C03 TaxID=1945858 RepID=UPI001115777C|nr:hypothetical protein [Rhodanobacter sp. C03]
MNASEIIEHWLQQIERIPAGDFIAIADFETFNSGARTESMQWCETMLSQAANPYAPPNHASHSYHPAGKIGLDLLHHAYVLDGSSVDIFEGVNFLIVRLPAPRTGAWDRASIEAAAKLMLRAINPGETEAFHYPSNMADGTLMSTAPMQDPFLTTSWFQREDMLLHHGKLFIVLYKRQPAIVGFQNDAQWFEDELRTVPKH